MWCINCEVGNIQGILEEVDSGIKMQRNTNLVYFILRRIDHYLCQTEWDFIFLKLDDPSDNRFLGKEKACVLFRIKYPCNLGSRVTNLILTLQTISFNRVQKGNRKKFLTHPITDGWSKLDLLSFLFSPKILGMHLLHL